MSGFDGLILSILDCTEFFRMLAQAEACKKLSKFIQKNFGQSKKVSIFAAALEKQSARSETCCGCIFIFDDGLVRECFLR